MFVLPWRLSDGCPYEQSGMGALKEFVDMRLRCGGNTRDGKDRFGDVRISAPGAYGHTSLDGLQTVATDSCRVGSNPASRILIRGSNEGRSNQREWHIRSQ